MANDTQKIWRYMDFAKFISLLANEALFFACPNKFQDPFEGHRPRSEMAAWSKILQKSVDDTLSVVNQIKSMRPNDDFQVLDENIRIYIRCLKDANRIATQRFGVSCWHKNDGENDAMWKLYSASGQGIAIQSTIEQLREAIENDTLIIDDVRYGNFDIDPIEKGHKRYGLFQKRKEFEHERELRATVLLSENEYGKGKLVKCDLDILITTIYVSPLMEEYVKDDIEKLCSNKIRKLDKPIIRSPLLTEPDYGIELSMSSVTGAAPDNRFLTDNRRLL